MKNASMCFVTIAIATVFDGCAATAPVDTAPPVSNYKSGSLTQCKQMEGDFVFRGESDLPNTTFLRAMARPGGAGIEWFRITIDVPSEKVHVIYFNGVSERVLESFIPAQCMNGILVERREDLGSQGGVRGPDSMELTYSRAPNGDLIVSTKSRGTTYYLPAVPSKYAADGTARFAKKP